MTNNIFEFKILNGFSFRHTLDLCHSQTGKLPLIIESDKIYIESLNDKDGESKEYTNRIFIRFELIMENVIGFHCKKSLFNYKHKHIIDISNLVSSKMHSEISKKNILMMKSDGNDFCDLYTEKNDYSKIATIRVSKSDENILKEPFDAKPNVKIVYQDLYSVISLVTKVKNGGNVIYRCYKKGLYIKTSSCNNTHPTNDKKWGICDESEFISEFKLQPPKNKELTTLQKIADGAPLSFYFSEEMMKMKFYVNSIGIMSIIYLKDSIFDNKNEVDEEYENDSVSETVENNDQPLYEVSSEDEFALSDKNKEYDSEDDE